MIKSFTVKTLTEALTEALEKLPPEYQDLPVYMDCFYDVAPRYICLVDIMEKHIRIADSIDGIYEVYSDYLTDDEFENGTDKIQILEEV